MKLYVIKDMKGDFRTQIISAPNDEQVIRLIPYFKQSDELIQRYPEDFALYCVGDFDFSSGDIIPMIPNYICLLSEERKENEKLA